MLVFSAQVNAVDVRIVPNTPLFEDGGCHVYDGAEAVRAVLQLIASARITVDISTFNLDNEATKNLIAKKASDGVSVHVYSSNGTTLSQFPGKYNVIPHPITTAKYRGATIIRVDNSFVGMGNIDLDVTMKVRSSFFVCQSGSNAKDMLDQSFKKWTRTTYEQ